MFDKTKPIYACVNNVYEIEVSGYRYGCPPGDQYYVEVSAYLSEHPEALVPEPVPPPPTPEQVAEQARRANLSYLAATDWYSIRYAETGKVIPEDILAKRQVARDAL